MVRDEDPEDVVTAYLPPLVIVVGLPLPGVNIHDTKEAVGVPENVHGRVMSVVISLEKGLSVIDTVGGPRMRNHITNTVQYNLSDSVYSELQWDRMKNSD